MNNDTKKLMYIVMIDIEMLLNNEVYKSSKDILGKLKNKMIDFTFKDKRDLLEEIKDLVEKVYQKYMGKTEDSDYLVLYKDFDRLYELVNKD